MGLFSSDSSVTENTTNQYDQRRIIGNGAVNADGHGSVHITTTDSGAINGAITLADRLGLGSFSLADSLGTNAFNLSDRVSTNAFAFSDRVNNQISGIADTAINNVAGAYADSGNRALEVTQTAMRSVAEAFNQSGSMVEDAYADAKGRGAMTDKILIGALVMAGLVAIFAVKNK